jgi:hypothetical protein
MVAGHCSWHAYRGFERKGDRVLGYNITVVLVANQRYGLKNKKDTLA